MENRMFSWSNHVFTAGNLAAFTTGLALLALVLWWIVLVRRRNVWLPLMRRMGIPPRVSPRLRMEPPPFVPFFCFLAAAVAASILVFEPGRVERQPQGNASVDSLLLIDLSPSVSETPLPELATLAADTWEALARDGKVTVGTTMGVEVQNPVSREGVSDLVSKSGYARAGVRLAGILQEQLAESGKVDRVVILSDDDSHSWSGLNSGFFRGRGVLNRVPTRVQAGAGNLFIESVRKASGFSSGSGVVVEAAPGAGRETWEVEILRRRREDAGNLGVRTPDVAGTLEVTSGERVLGRSTWNFSAGVQRIVVSVEIEGMREGARQAAGSDGDILEFRIEPDVPDAIRMDNEFRARRDVGPGSVRIISEPRGEGLLQDDAWQLATVLGILGYDVRRHDSAAAASSLRANRWVIQVGGAGHLENVCPAWLPERLGHASTVWLAPRGGGVEVAWSDLCLCYSRLTGVENPGRFCGEVTSRQGWIGLLPSLGAKQVGGRLGDERGSVAWRGGLAGQATAVESSVMAFTLPLEPSVMSGIDHASFPLMLKGLIELEQGASRQAVSNWPRITDSSAESVQEKDVPRTNVPAVESVLQSAAAADLPPVYAAAFGVGARPDLVDGVAVDEQVNPWPWVRGLASTAAAALVFEAVWMGGKWVLAKGIFSGIAILILFLSGLSLPAGLARADVEIIFAGASAVAPGARFNLLAREVASRTSISLVPVPRVWNPVKMDALDGAGTKPVGIDQPWLWSDGLKNLVQPGGRLNALTGRWLRRGGFLVIEGVSSREALDAAFKVEFPGVQWAPVPTDHELMRSFYLLDALPSCSPGIWHQLAFDGRVAAVAIPGKFSAMLRDGAAEDAFRCAGERASTQQPSGREKGYRAFVNLLMVALTTDYKKDQVHLPEILKRLR